MDIHLKINLFLFDVFGIEDFKRFIVNNDQKIINELFYNFEKCDSKSSQKLKLCTMKFCIETWQKNVTEKKRPIKRHGSKLFLFIRTVCKTKENSLLECSNIRRYHSRFN